MTVKEFYFKVGGTYSQALMTMMNDDFIKRMLVKFVEHNYYGYIEEAYNNKNFKGVFETAHSLKGTAGNLGLTTLYNDASVICDLTRNLDPWVTVDLDKQLNDLKKDHDLVVNGINELE